MCAQMNKGATKAALQNVKKPAGSRAAMATVAVLLAATCRVGATPMPLISQDRR